jgi:hypothetical protein
VLGLYRKISFLSFLYLIIYLIVVSSPVFFNYSQAINPQDWNAPFSSLVYYLLSPLSAGFPVFRLTGILFVFVFALVFNKILVTWKITKRHFLVPLAIFLIAAYFNSLFVLSPGLIAAFFVMLTLARIYNFFIEEKSDTWLFDIGFMIAVASLFYFPYIIFLPWAVISILFLKTLKIREFIVLLFGFISIYILFGVYAFWTDQFSAQWQYLISSFEFHLPVEINWTAFDWVKNILFLIIILVAIVRQTIEANKQVIQIRKYVFINLSIIPFLLIAGFMGYHFNLNQFILALIPIGLALGNLFSSSEKKILSESFHILLILIIFISQFVNFVPFMKP